ncbi:Zn(II)2Cys6 transcription factor [Apiospora marii]|uniref:Zn(II)2Cys6 transcription factor n=1 Tax=Apiospora marii TaxID=335849 RepID=UPI003130A2D6
MEPMPSSGLPSEASVPYGQACATCSQAKQKCVSRGGGKCLRCHRRGLDCPLRASEIEGKLDDLVSLLRAQNAIPQTASASNLVPMESRSEVAMSIPVPYSGSASTSHQSSAPSANSHVSSDGDSFRFHDAAQSDSCDSSSTSDGDGLHQSHADEILETFRTHCLQRFPFVYIAPSFSAQDMQRHRPFLWMNVQAICTKSPLQCELLGRQIREYLARKLFVKLERDLDLLQGLLTYLSWTQYHFVGKPFLLRFAGTVNALVFDLQLAEPPKSIGDALRTNNNPAHLFGYQPPVSTERTDEERRAILAAFIVSSIFRKADVVRWTPHVEDCISSLAANPEHYGDEILVAIAQIRKFVEEVAQVTWKRAEHERSSFAVLSYKSLRNRFELLKSSLQPRVLSEETIQLHLHDANLQASEIFIMHGGAPVAFLAPHLPEHVPSIATRIESLNICVEEVNAIIGIYFRSTPQEHAGLPFALHLCFGHAMQVLFTLNTLDDPDLDHETVLRCGALDASQVLIQALDIMERAASVTEPIEERQRPNHFRRGIETARANIDKWDAALKRTRGTTTLAAGSQNTAGLAPGAGTASHVDAAVQLYDPVLTEESDWLAELFTF